ncbi:MAPEG family protein [Ciceribacter selenitireducens]
MVLPVHTMQYAAILALIFVALSLWVSMGRAKMRVHHGDGGHAALNRRIRAHANFAEYVPFALLLIGLGEMAGLGGTSVQVLLAVLVAARLAHPFGMTAPEGSVRQYALRAPAMLATWAVIAVAAVLLLVR